MLTKAVMNVIEGGKADLFIIPNQARKISDFIGEVSQMRVRRFIEAVCKLNGVEFDENDTLVQVWYCAEDVLHSENFVDHGFKFNLGKETYWGRIETAWLPYSMIKDWKEGKTEHVYIPFKYQDDVDSPYAEASLALDLTPEQKKYRYNRFGTFEELMSTLVWNRQ